MTLQIPTERNLPRQERAISDVAGLGVVRRYEYSSNGHLFSTVNLLVDRILEP